MPRRKSAETTPQSMENQSTPQTSQPEPSTPLATEQQPNGPVDTSKSTADRPASDNQEPARRNIPDPFKIALDTVAGVELLESRKYRQMQIRFAEKPSPEVIDKVKTEGGFRWNGQDKVWVKQIQQDTAMTTRIDAERLYQDVAGMIRQDKGLGRTK